MMAAPRATLQLELPLYLERRVAPLHLQIAEQLPHAIREGLMTPGTCLRATRSVAATLGIARNSVMQAYEELFSEGYLVGRTGSGTYVEQSLPDFSRPRLPASVSTPALPRWLHKGERPAGEEAFGVHRSREPSCSGLVPQRIIARARERKVIVTALDAYYLGIPDRNGLLVGYGGLSLEELSRGAQIRAEVIEEQAHQGD